CIRWWRSPSMLRLPSALFREHPPGKICSGSHTRAQRYAEKIRGILGDVRLRLWNRPGSYMCVLAKFRQCREKAIRNPCTLFSNERHSVARSARISVACLMFLCAVLNARKGLLGWGPWFCIGLIFLLDLTRRQGESITAYFKRPQAFAAILLG